MSDTTPSPSPKRGEPPRSGLVRQTAEFLVALAIGILLFRTFAAEAYIVPTGSMAPTLLGLHDDVTCPKCGMHFALGVDEEGRAGRPSCPNCGQNEMAENAAVACSGDRLLVQKFLYDFRNPRRWEVAVFHFPGDPTQAYVKRVVGLPGEAIRISAGDILVDGKLARKSLEEQRAMRILVFDNQFVPRDSARNPRFVFHRGGTTSRLSSGWYTEGSRLVHDLVGTTTGPTDWLEYRHWDPDRGRFAPIYDFNPYNGGDLRGENRVSDLMVETKLEVGSDVDIVDLRIDSGSDRFIISFPFGEGGPVEVRRNGQPLVLSEPIGLVAPQDPEPRSLLLEASVMDRRLWVAIDGHPLFDPIDYDDPRPGAGADESPIALGVRNGKLTVGRLRIYRDVYYTSALANTPRRPFGVDKAFQLGRDEFFVLGDNSPVSNDSRFWVGSPVVPGELLLGKPFLVHLPGQAVPLKVFGRSVYWVPDPREIRYIR